MNRLVLYDPSELRPDVRHLRHSAADRTTPFEETLEAINDAYKDGKFKTFAISNFTASEVSCGTSWLGGCMLIPHSNI